MFREFFQNDYYQSIIRCYVVNKAFRLEIIVLQEGINSQYRKLWTKEKQY